MFTIFIIMFTDLLWDGLWPSVLEYVDEVIQALIENGVPFVRFSLP